MALIDRFFGRNKSLSRLSAVELRRQEIVLSRQRDKLLARIEKLAADKQRIFKAGAEQKSAEVRRALAQDFELLSQSQVLAARELNVRSKELLTVNRLRLVRENRERGRGKGSLNVGAGDVARIGAWIADDAISQEMYLSKLDALLEAGAEADRDALGQSEGAGAGTELLRAWAAIDRGKSTTAEFDRVDEAVRRRQAEGTQ